MSQTTPPSLDSSPDSSLAALSLAAPSLRRRMACWMYEGVLMFGVVWIAGYLFGTLSQTRNAMDNRLGLQIFLCIIFGIYFVFFWHKGQTLAMKTWHLRVVGLDGQAVSQKRALGRYLLSWLWFMPPLAAAQPFKLSAGEIGVVVFGWIAVYALLSRFHPQRQFLHDALAGTRLISHKPMSKTIPA
jgi:uncharacterized RDD family membrane protein YckC